MTDARATKRSGIEGWECQALREFGRVVGGGTPSRSRPKYWTGPIPWASVKDFTDENVFLHDTAEHISEEGLASSAATLVPRETPVVCTRMAVGRCALTTQATAINQDLKAFLLRRDVDPRFFIRLLRYYGFVLDRLSVGSTVRGISLTDLSSLEVLYPTTPTEQSTIAAIFDTVDATIARTKAVIKKLKQVRAGLLHDLLTRGLDESGQLRDSVTCPEGFRDSSVGPLPSEWKVETLASLLARGVIADIQDGNHGELHPKESDYVEQGIPFVMAADIAEDRIAIQHCKRIPVSLYKRLRIGHAFPGDVLLSHKASVGFVVRLGVEHGPVMLTPQVTYYRIGKYDRLDGGFLEWQMRGQFFQSQLQSLAAQSTRDYVGITAQKEISILLPDGVEEQKAISDHLYSIQCSIDKNDAEASKLRALKSGLMRDLFSGLVRVPETLETAEPVA
jgi:type I restriction enzyme S subunit